MKWYEIILERLAAETSVMPELLIEDAALVDMIRQHKPFEELVKHVNETF